MRYLLLRIVLPACLLLSPVFIAGIIDANATHALGVLCKDRVEIVKDLKKLYKEIPVAQGIAANGSFFEIFATREGNTWTMVATQSGGLTCVLANGTDWEVVPLPDLNEPDGDI